MCLLAATGLQLYIPQITRAFIDLAATQHGSLLLSRDRAVLKLTRKLALLGVMVTTPTAWAAGRGLPDHSPSC